MKKYFKVKGQPDEIKVSTGYELGGHNYFSGVNDRRGYYVYVQPVKRDGISESFVLFDGFKKMLQPVSRQTKRMEAHVNEEAEKMALELATAMAGSKGWELEEVQEDAKLV